MKRSLFEEIPADLPEELFTVLAENENVKIERVVSDGHASPEGFWYDQDRNEYVLLLKGSAGLLFEGKKKIVVMQPGDYVDIPAHVRHRVEWTDPEQETIWLAVNYLPY